MNRCEVLRVLTIDRASGVVRVQCRHRTGKQKLGHYLCGMHAKMLDRGVELVYAERGA